MVLGLANIVIVDHMQILCKPANENFNVNFNNRISKVNVLTSFLKVCFMCRIALTANFTQYKRHATTFQMQLP